MQIYTGFEIEIESNIPQSANYEDYRHTKDNLIDLAKDTEHITNTALQYIENYHSRNTDFRSTQWRLEEDSSLSNGAEFISPPELMDVSIKKLFDFFEYIDSSGCVTTKRCGLHVNMSADNKTLNGVDMPTFITLINQRLLFKLWGDRMQNNAHVRNIQNILKLKQYDIAMVYDIQNNIDSKINDVGNLMVGDRYNFVNRRRINGRNYIEIRVIGGEDYHKKKEEIKQTIEHFAKILEQAKEPEQLHKNTRKKITSYVNRISCSNDKDIFMPTRDPWHVITAKIFDNTIKQLKNIHKYSVNELISLLKKEGLVEQYSRSYDHTNIRKYFNKCITYMYNSTTIRDDKKTETYINYINYHYLKYIYNNFDKKERLSCFLNMRLTRSYGLHLPKDESKRNLFWMLKLLRSSSPKARKSFVDNLPIQVVNYILKRKVPGLITLAKARKRFIKSTEEI
jgi:hypothetical protein